jgi:Mannosyl-glycoprotein endo-beta-N-acetylglucosaminidase
LETKSSSHAGLLGIVIVAGIVLFVVMGAVGPHSWLVQKWNEMPDSSQSPAAGPSIVGGPSLSASKIDQILINAGSPAAGSGAEFVLDSAQYNIDDSVAMAFFHHESGFGTSGAAVQTHSIGNINCTAGYSCIGRFRSYPSWEAGIDDWYRLISGPAYAGSGLTTLAQIIPKYAPASDNNDESAYIAAVQSDVATWRSA